VGVGDSVTWCLCHLRNPSDIQYLLLVLLVLSGCVNRDVFPSLSLTFSGPVFQPLYHSSPTFTLSNDIQSLFGHLAAYALYQLWGDRAPP